MTSTEVIRRGGERARATRWRGDGEIALIIPPPDSPFLSGDFVRHCLDTLAGRGYRRVITSALSPLEQAGFLAAGFDIEERLRLLAVDLDGPLPARPPGYPLVRVPPWRLQEILTLDGLAFMEFWQFDRQGIREALRATPATRFRMALGPGRGIVGYAICGRSRHRGFVQRLAVAPSEQRRGTGRRLLLDGLHWMRNNGATRAVVNTQVSNEAAAALYIQMGFRDEPAGLSVLSAGL